MAKNETLRDVIRTLQTVVDTLKAALPEIESDATLGRTVRKLTGAASGLLGDDASDAARATAAQRSAATRAPAANANPKAKRKGKRKGNAKPKANANGKPNAPASAAADEKVLAVIRGKSKDGARSTDIAAATGLSGPRLRDALERLRNDSKVTSQGKTNQTRYFVA